MNPTMSAASLRWRHDLASRGPAAWSINASCRRGWRWAMAVAALGAAWAPPLCAQDAPPADAAATAELEAAPASTPAPRIEPSPAWLRVTKDHEVWVNFTTKQVMVGGRICLREGMLEMFACPRGTKEHESVVAVQTPARYVHAALVAVGAKPGLPVRFEPTYQPAQGTEIDIAVLWRDRDGAEHRAQAQEWVKEIKTGQAMTYHWVFAGSGFWADPDGKEQYYYGDSGDFICVSNFPTATLDLPVESSAANDDLMFGAFTEHIPPRDTPVMLVLTPKLPPSDPESAAGDAEAKAKAKTPPAVEPATPPSAKTPPDATEPAAPSPDKTSPPAPDAPEPAKPPAASKTPADATEPAVKIPRLAAPELE